MLVEKSWDQNLDLNGSQGGPGSAGFTHKEVEALLLNDFCVWTLADGAHDKLVHVSFD